MSRYEGGIGTRENGDLIRWTLDIDSGIENVALYGARVPVQTRPVEATLTLHTVTRDESIAVIEMLNTLRSEGVGYARLLKTPNIGDRFAGLEFD